MILQAAWVVPITAPPIRGGFVEVRAGRIVGIGSAGDRPVADATVVDLGDVVLTPGLVNPHTHLELTCYAGQLEPAPLWDWLLQLVKLRRAPGQIGREQQGVLDGAWQSLRAGVTCVGDISRRNLNWPVLRSVPIRKVCFVELLSLADEPPRNLAELQVGVAEVEEDPLLTAGITPHAPYTVPADQMRGAVELATTLNRPWCIHWAETPEELAFLRGDVGALPKFVAQLLAQYDLTSPQVAPIKALEACCAGARPGILAHCNYIAPGDAERLAAMGHTVVYCPRAHRFFGHAPHPYRELIDAGVTVAIGTDSAVGNENLALLEEVRFLRRNDPHAPPNDVLLRMITLDAARALGLESQIGSLEAGKQADLAAFPCPGDVRDPVSVLINSAPAPSGVWVTGNRVI